MKPASISVDLKLVGFIARESTVGTCSGCLFDGSRSSVCRNVCRAAVAAGQPDCDDKAPNRGNYIYVEADHRQLVLDGEGA